MEIRMRFRGTGYRALQPKWSHAPLSGQGAAIHGGRFNPRRVPALYLSLDVGTAITESQTNIRGPQVENGNYAAIPIEGAPLLRDAVTYRVSMSITGLGNFNSLATIAR
jgi:RES domain-containing protein